MWFLYFCFDQTSKVNFYTSFIVVVSLALRKQLSELGDMFIDSIKVVRDNNHYAGKKVHDLMRDLIGTFRYFAWLFELLHSEILHRAKRNQSDEHVPLPLP